MDHLNNNITSCLRVTQQYFVMMSCLFLNYMLSFIADYVFLLKLSMIKLSTILQSKKPVQFSSVIFIFFYFFYSGLSDKHTL